MIDFLNWFRETGQLRLLNYYILRHFTLRLVYMIDSQNIKKLYLYYNMHPKELYDPMYNMNVYKKITLWRKR